MSTLGLRFAPTPEGDAFHSNSIVSSEGIGSTSGESFERRKSIERNRQLVNGYRHAGIVHNYRAAAREDRATPTARSAEADSSPKPRNSMVVNRSTSRIDRPATNRAVNFREPGARGYNPYS